MTTTIMEIDDKSVLVTEHQKSVIETLSDTRKGGMAVLHGYSPDAAGKRYIERPVYNATILSRVSVKNLYKRVAKALENMEFSDIEINDEKLAKQSEAKLVELFNERKEFLLKRYTYQRKNAHTAAHERNYVRICAGVVGNLVTEYDKELRKRIPVIENGHYILNNILIEGLLVKRDIVKEGEIKPVNSQLKTRMGFAIERALPRVSSDYRRFSLTPETVERVSIDRS